MSLAASVVLILDCLTGGVLEDVKVIVVYLISLVIYLDYRVKLRLMQPIYTYIHKYTFILIFRGFIRRQPLIRPIIKFKGLSDGGYQCIEVYFYGGNFQT